MTKKAFYLKLAISIVAAIILFFGLNLAVNLKPYLDLFIISMVFFSIYNIALYYLSIRSAKSKIKNQFIHLVLYNVFFKIILAFVIVFIYYKTTLPEDKLFIVPFIICYLVFTVYETYFMSIQAGE